jgi:hypothetical protein
MLHLALWFILAIWVGIAILIALAIVGTIGVSTVRMLLDRRGVAGTVWCPLLQRAMRVLGPPAAFVGTVADFDDLRRCERWGNAPIQCHKWCLKSGELAEAAPSN